MASALFFGPFSPTIARIPQLRPVPVRQRSIIKVDENDEKIALRRMVAGRGILRNYGRNNNSPETGPETLDDTSWFGNWLALTNPVEMFLRFDRRAGFRALFLAKMSSAPEKRVIPCYECLNRKCELNQESSPTPGWLLPAICEQG